MIMLIGIFFALGFTIATLEKSTVMRNWDSRRCNIPVMTAAAFFKPDSDPRTSTAFAIDNFQFCVKSYVDSFMNLFVAPVTALFQKNIDITGIALDNVNIIRTIMNKLYNTFVAYLGQYFRRFHASIFEISKIIQYLRMAVNRGIAVAVSTIYTGLSMFTGMLNSIQFIIKVVLIICTIILILIVLLFFILFPIIPFVISVLVSIMVTVFKLSDIMSNSIANDANSKKAGFCFSEDTMILVKTVNGTVQKSVKDIVIGDELAENCGKVTAVIKMDGSDIQLYEIDGAYLSGTHLVKGLDKIWKAVANDVRAVKTDKESKILYCFNTTSNNIPVYTRYSVLLCRDWEEIGNDDDKGQYIWNYHISHILNKNSEYTLWKQNIKMYVNVAVIGEDTLVKTSDGFVKIKDIELLYNKVLDKDGKEQCVRGIVSAEIEDVFSADNTWRTEMYELQNGVWIKGISTLCDGYNSLYGMTLITENGEFIIWDEETKQEIVVRDFTEVGYQSIHETYSFVEARLRIRE